MKAFDIFSRLRPQAPVLDAEKDQIRGGYFIF